jgi:hypothetical protein
MALEMERVLLYGFGGGRDLGLRLRQLGYEPIAEDEPRAAAARLGKTGEMVRAALVPASFALPQRGGELDHLTRAAGSSGLRFVACGERPPPEALRRLRDKEVRLCLWTPFRDGELRFVLNRALFDPTNTFYDREKAEVRHDLRVPTELSVRVRVVGREKHALVYSLSVGGCYLETLRPTLVGGAIEITLPLPLGEFTVSGQVILTNVPGNLQRSNLPSGMGVEFQRLVPDAREAIQHYVRERARAYEL